MQQKSSQLRNQIIFSGSPLRPVDVHLDPELESLVLVVAAAAAVRAQVGVEDLLHAGVADVQTVAAGFDLWKTIEFTSDELETQSHTYLCGALDVDGADVAVVEDGVSLAVDLLEHLDHGAVLLAVGRAALHLEVEVPVARLAAFLHLLNKYKLKRNKETTMDHSHLEVERDSVKFQQGGHPESDALLVVERLRVDHLFAGI